MQPNPPQNLLVSVRGWFATDDGGLEEGVTAEGVGGIETKETMVVTGPVALVRVEADLEAEGEGARANEEPDSAGDGGGVEDDELRKVWSAEVKERVPTDASASGSWPGVLEGGASAVLRN